MRQQKKMVQDLKSQLSSGMNISKTRVSLKNSKNSTKNKTKSKKSQRSKTIQKVETPRDMVAAEQVEFEKSNYQRFIARDLSPKNLKAFKQSESEIE